MPRLPLPGSDNGTWGSILNDYLAQVHKTDGTLKDNVITNSSIVDGSIQEAKFSAGVQTKLNAISGTPDWNTISNKPAVIAGGATQADARTAIGAGTASIKADVGLGNVDNTSDATKNAAVATLTNKTISGAANTISNISQSAITNLTTDLSDKEPAISGGTTAQYWRGDKSWQTLDKSAVGLSNVDNTSDATKNAAAVTLTNKTLDNTNIATITDTNFTLQDDSDTTKQAKFQLSAIATGQTRTFTLPDSSGTLLTSSSATFNDSTFTIQDNADNTKQLRFEASAVTTGTTSTLTVPSSSTTLVGTDTSQTLTNKTLTSPILNTTVSGTAVATVATASTLALRDANGNLTANAYTSGSVSTVTAAGITTLTIASAGVQIFTGSSTQIVRLPTTSVVAGTQYVIANQSTGTVTVQSSGSNDLTYLSTNGSSIFTALVNAPATASDWKMQYIGPPRIDSVASSATPTINSDMTDQFNITALAANITSMTTNLSGTPVDGQMLMIRIKDNGTSRTITWGASFQSSGVAPLLAATTINREHHVLLVYSAGVSKWVCIAVDATGY